jgi:hypothetical protein
MRKLIIMSQHASSNNPSAAPYQDDAGFANPNVLCYRNATVHLLLAMPDAFRKQCSVSQEDTLETLLGKDNETVDEKDRQAATKASATHFLSTINPWCHHEDMNKDVQRLRPGILFDYETMKKIKQKSPEESIDQIIRKVDRQQDAIELIETLLQLDNGAQVLPERYDIRHVMCVENADLQTIAQDLTPPPEKQYLLLKLCTNTYASSAGITGKFDVALKDTVTVSQHPYRVKSVILHQGTTANSGHYIAASLVGNKIRVFNDQDVREYDDWNSLVRAHGNFSLCAVLLEDTEVEAAQSVAVPASSSEPIADGAASEPNTADAPANAANGAASTEDAPANAANGAATTADAPANAANGAATTADAPANAANGAATTADAPANAANGAASTEDAPANAANGAASEPTTEEAPNDAANGAASTAPSDVWEAMYVILPMALSGLAVCASMMFL